MVELLNYCKLQLQETGDNYGQDFPPPAGCVPKSEIDYSRKNDKDEEEQE